MRHLLTLVLSLFCAGPALAGPTLPEEDARPGKTRDQAIEAYLTDCHATLTATAWVEEEEQTVDECKALDVYQNCNPDIFGCTSKFDECQVACQAPCGTCQSSCATQCDGCKSACKAGDGACLRKCAERRADCRGGCLDQLKTCQGPTCEQTAGLCWKENVPKARACDVPACEQYAECVHTADDYEKARPGCIKKFASKLSDYCRGLCESYGGMIMEMLPDPETMVPDEPAIDGKALAAACTAAANCPADYRAVAPYLGGFCSGALDDASLADLERDVKAKKISHKTMSLVFNAYGAMYGYQFKKETWMNGFFYGPNGQGGNWLPPACKAKMKSVASAKAMPFRLTKLRDTVKRMWDAAK